LYSSPKQPACIPGIPNPLICCHIFPIFIPHLWFSHVQLYISKVDCSLWEPPRVSERMLCVNLKHQFAECMWHWKNIPAGICHIWDIWRVVRMYQWSDCNMFRNMLEHRRELWVHLGVFWKQCGNHKRSLTDVCVHMYMCQKEWRHSLRLYWCTRAIEIPFQQIWSMHCSSLFLLDYSSFVDYHFWIILVMICFKILFFTFLDWETKETGNELKFTPRYTEWITQPSDQIISIKDGANVIHHFSNFVRANPNRNTQLSNGPK
jgi:hypothetical protein